MSFINFCTLFGALALTARVSAHGVVTGIVVDGVYSPGFNPSFTPYQNPVPAVAGWTTQDGDLGFVSDYSSPDIICHKSATPGAAYVTVAAGDKVELQWTNWPVSHKGPVMDYLASCKGDCTTVDKTTLLFSKIDQAGLIDGSPAPGTWASDTLIANNNSWTVTIPPSIAPGNYVLRHETIALHSAENVGGSQAYPQCINLKITGSGTDSLTTGTLAEDFYTNTDPGILVNIYYPALTNYTIPGPPLLVGAVSASQPGGQAPPSPAPSASTSPSTSASVAAGTASPPWASYGTESWTESASKPASTSVAATATTSPSSATSPWASYATESWTGWSSKPASTSVAATATSSASSSVAAAEESWKEWTSKPASTSVAATATSSAAEESWTEWTSKPASTSVAATATSSAAEESWTEWTSIPASPTTSSTTTTTTTVTITLPATGKPSSWPWGAPSSPASSPVAPESSSPAAWPPAPKSSSVSPESSSAVAWPPAPKSSSVSPESSSAAGWPPAPEASSVAATATAPSFSFSTTFTGRIGKPTKFTCYIDE